jgi:hypothetical protein
MKPLHLIYKHVVELQGLARLDSKENKCSVEQGYVAIAAYLGNAQQDSKSPDVSALDDQNNTVAYYMHLADNEFNEAVTKKQANLRQENASSSPSLKASAPSKNMVTSSLTEAQEPEPEREREPGSVLSSTATATQSSESKELPWATIQARTIGLLYLKAKRCNPNNQNRVRGNIAKVIGIIRQPASVKDYRTRIEARADASELQGPNGIGASVGNWHFYPGGGKSTSALFQEFNMLPKSQNEKEKKRKEKNRGTASGTCCIQ